MARIVCWKELIIFFVFSFECVREKSRIEAKSGQNSVQGWAIYTQFLISFTRFDKLLRKKSYQRDLLSMTWIAKIMATVRTIIIANSVITSLELRTYPIPNKPKEKIKIRMADEQYSRHDDDILHTLYNRFLKIFSNEHCSSKKKKENGRKANEKEERNVGRFEPSFTFRTWERITLVAAREKKPSKVVISLGLCASNERTDFYPRYRQQRVRINCYGIVRNVKYISCKSELSCVRPPRFFFAYP